MTTDLRKVFDSTPTPPPPRLGTHDPDLSRIIGVADTEITDRAVAVYLAIELVGQRTPEEIVVMADYLRTGVVPPLR